MTILMWENYGAFDRMEFDATLSEDYNVQADVTEHPVESGGSISDGVRQKPVRLSFVGVITETPIYEGPGLTTVGNYLSGWAPYELKGKYSRNTKSAAVHGGLRAPIDPPGFTTPQSTIRVDKAVWGEADISVGGQSLQFFDKYDRIAEVFDMLCRLQADGVEIQVIGSLKTYDKMVISSIRAPKGPEGSVEFSVELVSFRTADTVEEDLVVKITRPVEKRSVQEAPATVTAPVALAEEDDFAEKVKQSHLDRFGNGAVPGAELPF